MPGVWVYHHRPDFYSRPCGRGDVSKWKEDPDDEYFYSRPCGRGDVYGDRTGDGAACISTHAPAGGATRVVPSTSIRI